MTDVQEWSPSPNKLDATHARVLSELSEILELETLNVSAQQAGILESALSCPAEAWIDFAQDYSDQELVGWIKALTLWEAYHEAMNLGAKSPVIPLARVLRQRGSYSNSVTRWIRQHSDNRFLPYGSVSQLL